jgi:hypothetical protein
MAITIRLFPFQEFLMAIEETEMRGSKAWCPYGSRSPAGRTKKMGLLGTDYVGLCR